MINLPDADAIIDALHSPIDPALRELIAGRFKDAIALDLADMTHMLVVEPGDTEADVKEAIGFSPLVSRIDGSRGHLDFDWIEHHPGEWMECIRTIGNDGYAVLLFLRLGTRLHPSLQPMESLLLKYKDQRENGGNKRSDKIFSSEDPTRPM